MVKLIKMHELELNQIICKKYVNTSIYIYMYIIQSTTRGIININF